MTAARVLESVVRSAIGSVLTVRIDCWDGSSVGPPDAELHIRWASPRALRRLHWAPNELGFARAYVSGDIQLEGDLLAALERLNALADPVQGPGVHLGRGTTAAVAAAVVRLGVLGLPPKPPPKS